MHTATWSERPTGPASNPRSGQWSGQWSGRVRTGLERSRDWLDDRGKGAWIVAMVIGFILFWPIGLALLAYMIWSNRMRCKSWNRTRHTSRAYEGTGNSAFDSYRSETLKRLEEERDAFVSFLDELRSAKDRAEFDQFMARRADDRGTETVPAA